MGGERLIASIAQRRRHDGSVGYQVRWRQDGRWQPDVFDTERKAQRFRLDVEDAGNRWPAGWIPGIGYLEDAAAPAGRTAFGEFAERYLNTAPRCRNTSSPGTGRRSDAWRGTFR